MIPEELFKPRHFGTPESFYIITTNYIVLAIAMQCFASGANIYWFFWVSMGLLAIYNAYQINRYRDEYNKVKIIAYVLSLAGMVLLFYAFRGGANHVK